MQAQTVAAMVAAMNPPSVLLIHPPVSKPCEPPAGLARLAGALRQHDISCRTLDLNPAAIRELLSSPIPATDTFTHRAVKHREQHLSMLTSPTGYVNPARYRRAISELDRLLAAASAPAGARVNLVNYQHDELNPLNSADLRRAAEEPHLNPFTPFFIERLTRELTTHSPTLIGLSLNFLSQALSTMTIIGLIKNLCPGIPIILGGGLVTSWQAQYGQLPFADLVDHIIAGPGEEPLLRLCGTEMTEPAVCPDYTDLLDEPLFAPGPILPLSTSSGCYWSRCSFCPERAEGSVYRPLPCATVHEQLQVLVPEHRPALIHFLDNALSPALLRQLCSHPPGAPWYGFARVHEDLADEDFCRSLKKAGCVMLQLGIESGDQQVLEALQKGIELSTITAVLQSLKRAGIATYCYLLFGTPAETPEAAGRTLDFTARHAPWIDFLNLAIFNLPAASDEARTLDTRQFYNGDLSLYSAFAHPSGWNRKQVRHFLDREFTRHPAIGPIILRDPPQFTSNHAAFFTRGQRSKT